MSRSEEKYRKLLEAMPDAFAYHQVLYDADENPVDYIFLEINDAFEKLTGLKREKVIGKKVTEVHPDIGESEFDWIGVYGKVANDGETIRFEQYFEPDDRWYDVSAFSDEQGYFAVSFREITLQKNENLALARLVGVSQEVLNFPAGDISYQVISDRLLELSGAKFAGINVYDHEKGTSVTMAISGLSDNIRKVVALLGFELVGKAWDIIPERVNAIKEGRLLQFGNIYDSASGALSKKMAVILERIFGIGKVYVIEIGYEGETIGDLIIFMPRYKTISNPQVIELYAAQVGFALMRYQVEEELRISWDQYQSLTDNLPGTSYRCLYDEQWTMIYMSSDIDNITGYPSSDFINNKVRSYASVICKDDNDNDEIIKEAINAGENWDIEYRVIHSDGSIRWVHEKGRAVTDVRGNVAYIDGLLLDISDRKKIEEALKESELRHRALVEAIPDLLFRYNEAGEYLDVVVKDAGQLHQKARELYRQDELIGKSLFEVLPETTARTIVNGIKEAISTGEMQFIEYSFPVGERNYYYEARLAPIGHTEVVSIVRNITERINYQTELERISLHDGLTGLFNRHYFDIELGRLGLSRDYPITIISADLDGLKLVNDTLGHSEGDSYLQNGASILKNTLRISDILARVGGDEFAIILPRTDRETAVELVKRMQAGIARFNQDNTGLPISISIGYAVSESSDRPLEEVYKEADNNMYKDKLKRGQQARADIVGALVATLSKRNDLGEGNRKEVEKLAKEFGRYLQLDETKLENLILLSKVYDIGKVNMPDRLVHSSLYLEEGKFTDAEKETIRRHPEIGFRIASSSPELVGVAELIMYHHERFDGSGYPLGLKGEEIPLECRILAIVTAYSSMISSQTDGKKLKPNEALTAIKNNTGSHFDPKLVDAFLKHKQGDTRQGDRDLSVQ
ncbi:MAG: diguanylate cyclase [Bacillota bacterium]|nr:diguanylate cyclase [Bacillota bacterium]